MQPKYKSGRHTVTIVVDLLKRYYFGIFQASRVPLDKNKHVDAHHKIFFCFCQWQPHCRFFFCFCFFFLLWSPLPRDIELRDKPTACMVNKFLNYNPLSWTSFSRIKLSLLKKKTNVTPNTLLFTVAGLDAYTPHQSSIYLQLMGRGRSERWPTHYYRCWS